MTTLFVVVTCVLALLFIMGIQEKRDIRTRLNKIINEKDYVIESLQEHIRDLLFQVKSLDTALEDLRLDIDAQDKKIVQLEKENKMLVDKLEVKAEEVKAKPKRKYVRKKKLS